MSQVYKAGSSLLVDFAAFAGFAGYVPKEGTRQAEARNGCSQVRRNKPVDTVKQQGLMLWDWMQIDMSSNMLKLIVTRICLFVSWHYFPHFISSARQKRKTKSHVWKLIAPLVAIFGWLAFPKVYRQLLRNEAEMAADLRLMEDRSLKGFHVTGCWTSNMHVQAISCFISDFNECL